MKPTDNVLSPEACFLLRGLSADEATAACALLPSPLTVEKGTPLSPTYQGEPALGILLSGSASVARRGTDGKAQACNRIERGEAFGAAALFTAAVPVSTVTALTPLTVLFVPQSALLALMRQYPPIGENLARFLTDRIRFLNRSLNGLRGGTAADRLLAYLRTLADRNGVVTLPPLSSLAAKLAMGRTSLYRAFDDLEQAGALRKDGKTVTLTHLS